MVEIDYSLAALDSRYLKLDCSNDPLTDNLHIRKTAIDAYLYIDTHSTDADEYSRLYFRKSDTNTTNIVQTDANDYLGNIKYMGVNDSGAFAGGAYMSVQQTGVSGDYVPTSLEWATYSSTGVNDNQFKMFSDGSCYVGTGFDFGIGTTKWNSGDDIDGVAIAADTIDDLAIDWGTGANQVGAVDLPIADAGGIITGTEVETALQENRTAINLNTTHAAGDGSDHADVATNTAGIATNVTAIGLNTTHRGLTNNPHSVTLAQVGGANPALSNLASVQINSSLLFDTDSAYDIGDTSKFVANAYVDSLKTVNITAGDGAGSSNLNLQLLGLGTGYVQVGSTATSHSLNAPGDLMVGGDFEVNGTAYFDGHAVISEERNIMFKAWSNGIKYDTTYIGGDGAIVFWINNTHYKLILTSSGNFEKAHDHADQINPTLFIHSATNPDDNNTQWISLTHDQTDGVIDVGTGFIKLNDQVLFTDKAVFTQIDGNEYIDSLNDGYLDLGATTAIRLLQDTNITGNLFLSENYSAQFRDAQLYVNSDADGHLDLHADTSIDMNADVRMTDAKNMILDTTTGTQLATATGQKLGFWGVTAVVQQILATGGGATVDNVISLLQTLGLCKQA